MTNNEILGIIIYGAWIVAILALIIIEFTIPDKKRNVLRRRH